MKNNIVFFLKTWIISISIIGTVSCQTINWNQPIPADKTIKKGVLPNGMTYYLHSTDVTENVASYYIIQNVGSILENDNQQGLAHFLEHMAFNGTETFEGKGILNTFQKHGLVFGKDINAYTSFDETVYNINRIPTTPELIDTGLQVLRDWSNYLLLTDEEIDAERGVIKEEWRTRQSGTMRIFKSVLGTRLNNSKYSHRMPIGLMDIVENFDYKALRDFYHKWYRTDLQAIAIVGDFDVDEMEQKIIAKFSSIPAVENPSERQLVQVEDHEGIMYQLATDKEISTPSISFSFRYKKTLEDETLADFKANLIRSMTLSMLSSRIRESLQDPDVSYLGASARYMNTTRLTRALDIRISPKPNQQAQAFKDVLTIINRAVKFGFTKAEIDRTITKYTSSYKNGVQKLGDRSHKQIVQVMQSNYLNNTAMADLTKKFEIAKVIFDQLQAEDIHKAIKKLYTKNNRVLIVTGVEGKDNLTEKTAVNIINEIENSTTLTAYTDDFLGKTLISGLNIIEGKITDITTDDIINATTFTLSNGVQVHYKFSDKNKNNVRLMTISDGGKSLVDDEDIPSANVVPNLVGLSGIGDYTAIELQKIMAGKSASTNIGISELTEQISGSSVTKDVETMLQLVHLRFVKPRFDKKSYQILKNNMNNDLVQKQKSVGSKIKDSITVSMYGKNNSRIRIFNEHYINATHYDKAKEIYLERFQNVADFKFFIVGDVKQEDLKPLLEKYIASIPSQTTKEKWLDKTVDWIDDTIDKDIFIKMEDPKGVVDIRFISKMDYTLKNYYLAKTLGDILRLRFTETLREQEGGTYGAKAKISLKKKPHGLASVGISFDCNPEKADHLVDIVYNEIHKIKEGQIQQIDLDKTLKSYLKSRSEQKNYNSYDMSLLKNYFLESYNMDDKDNFENIITNITTKDVQNFVIRLLKDAKTSKIIFRPKLD